MALARALRMPYVEGDDLHPHTNVDKMAAGIPLDDADREPWLALIRATAERTAAEEHAAAEKGSAAPRGVVITCSALKKYYREILRGQLQPAAVDNKILEAGHPNALQTYFVFIEGTRDVLMDRMSKRAGHFMKASMLDSQLSTLETPIGEESVVVVSVEDSTEDQVRIAKEGLASITGGSDKDEQGKQ